MRTLALTIGVAAWAAGATAQGLDPVSYVVRVPAADTPFIEVAATIPADGAASIDLMMPVWSPGYYRVEDYAAQVTDLSARDGRGEALSVDKPQSNRWRVEARGARTIVLTYRVFCNQRSVTTNYVDSDYGVLNGAPTFITIAERARRRHAVRLELPPGWPRAMTGLDDAPDGQAQHFVASDYETLVDSPILAGRLGVTEFTVAGRKHSVVGAGDMEGWDAAAATRELQRFVEENARSGPPPGGSRSAFGRRSSTSLGSRTSTRRTPSVCSRPPSPPANGLVTAAEVRQQELKLAHRLDPGLTPEAHAFRRFSANSLMRLAGKAGILH